GLPSLSAWADSTAAVDIDRPRSGEDLFSFVQRLRGLFDSTFYRQILGAANEFKEGDAIVGVAAPNKTARSRARELLGNTRLSDIKAHPPWTDELSKWIDRSPNENRLEAWRDRTFTQLKDFLLKSHADQIRLIL